MPGGSPPYTVIASYLFEFIKIEFVYNVPTNGQCYTQTLFDKQNQLAPCQHKMVELSVLVAILAILAGFTMAIEGPPASSSVLLNASSGIADDLNLLQNRDDRQQLMRSDRVDVSYQIVYQLGYRQECKFQS